MVETLQGNLLCDLGYWQANSLPSEPPWKPRIYLFTIISQTQHSLQVLSKVGGGINYEFGINTDTPPSSLRSVLFDSLLPHGTVAHQAPLSMASTDKRVTPRLPWRNGSPLAFRVVHAAE